MARVPLIVRGPGVVQGKRCASLVSTLDLVPLFYRACGVEPPDTLQGIDLTPALTDPAASVRDTVYSENLGAAMVFDGRFKYAHYVNGDAELYDLQADPHEVANLVGSPAHAGEVARLRALLLEHALRNQRQHARAVERPPEPQRAALNAAYERRIDRETASEPVTAGSAAGSQRP